MSIWLIGSGLMAQDYMKALKALGAPTTVIGRGAASAKAFEEATGVPVVQGGLDAHIASGATLPEAAIVAVGVEQLGRTAKALLRAGVRRILVEKPGGVDAAEVREVAALAESLRATVVLGYNRRFYAPVLAAREMIAEDGGPTSFMFEFTEWSHVIATLDKPAEVMANWFLANSTHVVDLAFYLGGAPERIACYTSGALDWHPDCAVFAGAGMTREGTPFSYHANWAAPGRWGVEVLTAKRRYIFRPMEQLHVQEIGSVAVTRVELDDALDTEFKPGLYLEVRNFLEGRLEGFCTIAEQSRRMNVYESMCGRGACDATRSTATL